MDAITQSIDFEWSYNQRIAVYRVRDINVQEMIDWGAHVSRRVAQWQPPNGARRLLFDVSHPGVAMAFLALSGRDIFNPAVTRNHTLDFRRFRDDHPTIPIYLALLVSASLSGNIALKYNRSSMGLIDQGSSFIDRDAAEQWLIRQPENREDL